MKNKKSIYFIIALLFLSLIGGVFAFFSSDIDIENIFTAGTYKTVTREVFTSPEKWKPGDETPKTIVTKNEGNIPVKVRIKMEQSWISANGDPLPLFFESDSENCVYDLSVGGCVEYFAIVNLDNRDDWLHKGEYFYYVDELAPGEETSSLIKSVTYNENAVVDVSCSNVGGVYTCESSGDGYDGATFNLNITVETVQASEYQNIWNNIPIDYDYVGEHPCTYNGELEVGAEYVNGQYTYRYRQIFDYDDDEDWYWVNIDDIGWGVTVTDYESTDPITTTLCSSINNKPIVNMRYLFDSAEASSIDLSSFDTSNVTDMSNMFSNSKASTIDLSGLDTSRVTDMYSMFDSSEATSINLTGLDTSKVTDMGYMFLNSKASTLDLSSFDTSNVKNMRGMFYQSEATNINLSSFDTSNVVNMYVMFYNSLATNIDVSSFDTSKVTNMAYMFSGTHTANLNLSNFDTSKVTNMASMFSSSGATTINVSSFDTSNVTDMSYMFASVLATSINLNSFDTSKVKNMMYMFWKSSFNTLDLSSFNTTNVTDMSFMFCRTLATSIDLSSFRTPKLENTKGMFYISNVSIIDLSTFDTSKITDMSTMFHTASATVGYGRTQADCDRLNASSGKPSTLTFVLK